MINHVPCACGGQQLHYSVHEVRCPALDTYANVLPEMQRDAAALLGGLLHGR
jgi:hypothetical protein